MLSSGPQAPGMPIILAPRPLSNQEATKELRTVERPDSLPLEVASTDISSNVPAEDAAENKSEEEEKKMSQRTECLKS